MLVIAIAVTNSTCLIGLERAGHLDLLQRTFSRVYAPPAVAEEFGYDVPWLLVQPVTNRPLLAALEMHVHSGEAAAIALATEIADAVVILDDIKARKAASRLGIRITGTIGVILQAKKHGIIPAVRPVLAGLHKAGFFVSEPLYREALCLACETEQPP